MSLTTHASTPLGSDTHGRKKAGVVWKLGQAKPKRSPRDRKANQEEREDGRAAGMGGGITGPAEFGSGPLVPNHRAASAGNLEMMNLPHMPLP